MAKISNEAKTRYAEIIKEYKSEIEKITQSESAIVASVEADDENEGYKKLTLAELTLDLVSYYVLMNSLSIFLLGLKNEGFLNAARKASYKGLIYLEDAVSPYVDAPFSDYEGKLARIEKFQAEKRIDRINKMGYSIQAVIHGFGDNSKWKWSFVELEGRLAAVSKNLLDLKNLITGLDPRASGFEARTQHLRTAKSMMQAAADKYRQKYELTTLRIDDFKMAIRFLIGLRRLHIILAENEEAQALKMKIEIWRAKMEADLKKNEQKANVAKKVSKAG